VLCVDLTVKLCDFGLSKSESTSMLLNATMSSLGIQAGTLAFMAPEITERGAGFSKATDMYSMGMTAVQLISRKTPNKIDLARKVRDCVAFATAAPGSHHRESLNCTHI
jgi:serine/threonine protein kinase